MQTSMPSPYTGMVDGLRKITATEGIGGLYKGLYPLWGRQIPYTMVSDNWLRTPIPLGNTAVDESLILRPLYGSVWEGVFVADFGFL